MFLFPKKQKVSGKKVVVCADFANSQNKNALVEYRATNVVEKDGCLCCAQGTTQVLDKNCFGALELPDGALVYCDGAGIHYEKGGVSEVFGGVNLTKPTMLFCQNYNAVIVSQENVGTFAHNADGWSKTLDVGFLSLAFCNERVFGVSGNNLYYTVCGNVASWEGKVCLPCQVNAVAACENQLYLFGKDLFSVKFNAQATSSKITTVFNNFVTVYPKTVAAHGNKILFFSKKGLFCLCGNTLKQITLNCNVRADNSDAVATVCGGDYYLSFGTQNRKSCDRLAKVNCASLKVETIFSIATNFLFGTTRLLFGVNNKPHAFSAGAQSCHWTSKPHDFGTTGKKFLRKLEVSATNAVDVVLRTENLSKQYYVSGGTHKINVCGAFDKLVVEIMNDTNAVVEKVAVTAFVPTQREVEYGNY